MSPLEISIERELEVYFRGAGFDVRREMGDPHATVATCSRCFKDQKTINLRELSSRLTDFLVGDIK